jgi:CheY-like chemotaxis protein
MGIGLFMVARIVELHGGSVSAHSDGPGRGSLFAMHLPLAARQEAAEPADATTGAPPDLAGVRVLVVDDDDDTLDLLRESLQSWGAEVSTATSVSQALSACGAAGAPFDLIVSDLAMPEEDGFGLLTRVRALPPPLHAIPVVALTAHASEDDGRRALAFGFERYLSKPIDPAALAVAVGATARQNAAFPSRP